MNVEDGVRVIFPDPLLDKFAVKVAGRAAVTVSGVSEVSEISVSNRRSALAGSWMLPFTH